MRTIVNNECLQFMSQQWSQMSIMSYFVSALTELEVELRPVKLDKHTMVALELVLSIEINHSLVSGALSHSVPLILISI